MKKFRVWCAREQMGIVNIEAEDEGAAWELMADQDPLQDVNEVGTGEWGMTAIEEVDE